MADVERHFSVQRIHRIANALGDLRDSVTFIGGAIAPLLQTDPPFDSPRPTEDADAVTATDSYAAMVAIHEQLRQRGFRQSPDDARHVHRWRSPDDDKFDLVPAGTHLGATGQTMDRYAIDTADVFEFSDGLRIRHATSVAFLAMKWAAHNDRGAGSPYDSHDLEDILALVAARPRLPDEVRSAAEYIRAFVGAQFVELSEHRDYDDLLAGHLNNAQDRARVIARTHDRIQEIVAL